ncbi:aldehyde dehydrogenase family protein [Streptomyces meridianus]|uniref:Aldehyde dehydrogenase family protein n=1 Tax=Streptomyces meridianus TaxID=2938945 RepID=A0ABT0XC53_9ACTN|nr:aldehyde dehydrogenase family protein [Streptomyces meridianus]MCM2580105.1 aldehyde dehydrogenase family protein [Streptomyces meridianus]
MSFLDPRIWSGSIRIDGWTRAHGGDAPVVEPATGETLERVGLADGQDVAKAAARAHEAGRAWARTPYTERAAVLRRAGDLMVRHAEEIQDWIVREDAFPSRAEARGIHARSVG